MGGYLALSHEAVVRLLVKRDNVDINARDNYGWIPLSVAAKKGQETVVRLLVERADFDFNIKNGNRRTPLSVAAKKGTEAFVAAYRKKRC